MEAGIGAAPRFVECGVNFALGDFDALNDDVTYLVLAEVLTKVIVIYQEVVSWLLFGRFFDWQIIVVHIIDTKVDQVVIIFLFVFCSRAKELALLPLARIQE